MRKARVISDLHLEFMGPEFNPGSGDILFLAGDILTARNLNKDESSPKRQCYLEFLDACSQNYNDVFYIAGNHEHYGYDINRSTDSIRNALMSNYNAHFLQNDEFILGDWVVLGTTLWTDLKNNDPMVKWDVARSMNDCRVIRINNMRFTPDRWWAEHFASFQWLHNKLAEHKDKKVLVMTHHAPSVQSIHQRYLQDRHYNQTYGYFTNLDEWILARPQIKYWLHGHTHNSSDYQIGNTRVIANPRGYPIGDGTELENPNFKIDLSFDLN